jgi:DNA-binding NarL/FixJ family response regulator
MHKIKIIIADDHSLIRLGLNNVIATNSNLELLSMFDNGEDALQYIVAHEPDLAILDIDMPGLSGLEVCQKVREKKIGTKILFLSMLNQHTVFTKARELGANGYLLKDFIVEEIFIAIAAIFKGIFYTSEGLELKLNNNSINNLQEHSLREKLSILTPTEQKILKLIALNLN